MTIVSDLVTRAPLGIAAMSPLPVRTMPFSPLFVFSWTLAVHVHVT